MMMCTTAPKAPHYWTPDVEALACFVCRSPFSVVIRKHHCRKCGSVVCHNCSKTRVCVPEHGLSEPVRVCDECMQIRAEDDSFGADEVFDGIRALQHSHRPHNGSNNPSSSSDDNLSTATSSNNNNNKSGGGGGNTPMVVQSLPSLGEAQANGLAISLLCDGCDKELGVINAVRYWCADCRDFELCSECFGNVEHPHLRFVQWDGRTKTSGFMCASSSRKGDDDVSASSRSNDRGRCVVPDQISRLTKAGSPAAASNSSSFLSRLSCRSARSKSESDTSADTSATNNNNSGDGDASKASRWKCSVPARPSMPGGCGSARTGVVVAADDASSADAAGKQSRMCSTFRRPAPWEESNNSNSNNNNGSDESSKASSKWLPKAPNCMRSRNKEATQMDEWDDAPAKRSWRPASPSSEASSASTWVGTIKDRASCRTSSASSSQQQQQQQADSASKSGLRGKCSVGSGNNNSSGSSAASDNAMFRTNCFAGRV